jgi:divalent metal cation (Fe/Co/Zn/Cd) transporter
VAKITTDRITSKLVREVASTDDREWFANHPETTVRHRRYLHGELGLNANSRWWLAEAQELREQVRDELHRTDGEVYVVLKVTRTPRGLHRQFAYVALELGSRGWGLLPDPVVTRG